MSWIEEAVFEAPVGSMPPRATEAAAMPREEVVVVKEEMRAAAESTSLETEPILIREAPLDAEEASLVIATLDGKQQTITLRLGLSGMQAALAVGAYLGVLLREEFALAFPEKKGWLDEEASLGEQGLQAGATLVFKKKYFIADEELSRVDETDIRLMYPQCVDGLVSGFFKADQGHVIGLGALEARVYQAAHEERMPSVAELTGFLPMAFRDGATVKCVIDQVEAMKLMSEMEYGCLSFFFSFFLFC